MALRNKKWYMTSVIVASSILTAGVLYFTWNANRVLGLMHVQYFEENDTPRLLLFYADTPYSEDDGYYLNGYEVKLVDPGKEDEEITSLYIDRYVASPPPWPSVKFYGFENIWLIQPNQFVQGDTGYVRKIKLVNNQLIDEPCPLMRGFSPAQAWGKHWFILKNKYNEMSCLDLRYNQVSAGQCTATEHSYDTITCAFIAASKESGSTRYKIYFYENSQPDPMQVSAGMNQSQSLLYSLWFSQNKIEQTRLDEYIKKFGPGEKITMMATDYLLLPQCIYKSRDKAVYMENDTDKKRVRFYCFGRGGEVYFKIDDDRLQFGDMQPPAITCVAYKNKFILWCQKWAMAVDSYNGKILWHYPL